MPDKRTEQAFNKLITPDPGIVKEFPCPPQNDPLERLIGELNGIRCELVRIGEILEDNAK